MAPARNFTFVTALLSLAICSGALATTTINFDPQDGIPAGDLPSGLSAMSNSPGGTVPTSAQLSNQYAVDGVLFSSSAPYVAVVDIGSSSASPPNGIGGATSGGLLSYADPVTFTFVLPDSSTPGVTNDVSITADSDGIPGQFATLTAFGAQGQVLDAQTLNDLGGETWSMNVPGIHSATFNFPTTSAGLPTTGSPFGNGTGIALDNLTFGEIAAEGGSTPVGNAVPLPRTVWSALALFGILAARQALRRPASIV